jgi:hypothetical protein
VHDSEEKGPDGIVLKDRMSGLIESITADIEQCGDKWTNKGLMCTRNLSTITAHQLTHYKAKMLRSKAYYEEQFAGYVEKFRNYKEEIGRALAVHTTYSASQALIDNIGVSRHCY